MHNLFYQSRIDLFWYFYVVFGALFFLGVMVVASIGDSVRLRLARGIAPELADAADDYDYLCKRLVDAGRRVTELHQANARLGEAAMEMQQERDAAQAELENIRARGYGQPVCRRT